jgi:hypothetical protein
LPLEAYVRVRQRNKAVRRVKGKGGRAMAKIVRHEFLGNPFVLVILCITIVGIPLAVFHFIVSTVTVEEEIDDPTGVLEAFRAGKVGK